jgi:hypothetical protein
MHAPDVADMLVETPSGLSTTAKTTQLKTPMAAPTTYGFHDLARTALPTRTAAEGAFI